MRLRSVGGGEESDTWFVPSAVSISAVDAGGVPAEWVEAVAATAGQSTLVHFGSARSSVAALAAERQTVCDLAIVTEAPILSVGCVATPGRPHPVVDDGGEAIPPGLPRLLCARPVRILQLEAAGDGRARFPGRARRPGRRASGRGRRP